MLQRASSGLISGGGGEARATAHDLTSSSGTCVNFKHFFWISLRVTLKPFKTTLKGEVSFRIESIRLFLKESAMSIMSIFQIFDAKILDGL